MDHREPPPIVAGDPRPRSVSPPASDRLALPPPAIGLRRPRIDRRWAFRSLALIVGLLVGAYTTYLTARAARSWLGDQPAYQLRFEAIVLDPPPPSWFRGGTAGFLQEVRRQSQMPESIPVLQLKEGELRRAFERSPWIEEVSKILYRPLGITVRLAYRRPVALVEIKGGNAYLVDASAVILPHGDLETDVRQFVERQGLIRIVGIGLAEPHDPKPGITWRPRPGATDIAPGNAKILAAAKLAGFLVERTRAIDRSREPALGIRYINPMDPDGRGLFLKNDESTFILWGEAPGEETPGNPTAAEKWEKLSAWSRGGRTLTTGERDYWEITPTGVVLMPFAGHPSAESARVSPPRKDRATIPAKGSGQ